MVLGLAASFFQVLLLLFGAGLGGSVQHPVASSFVSRAYDGRRRATALGVLNFAGDLGKFIVPLVLAFSLTTYGWRSSLFALGAVSLLFSWVFWRRLSDKDHQQSTTGQTHKPAPEAPTKGWGIQHPQTFSVILSMGVLDASVRSALLTFVPFLLLAKGMTEVQAGLMLTIIFAGGAAGKLGCGLLADRLGTALMIALTEACTGAFIVLLLLADAWAMTPLLFCVGFFLNGTSSVLLDGVADLFDATKRSRGYGLYFTIYLGAGAIGPIVYGVIGDVWRLPAVFIAMAAASLVIIPLTALYQRSRIAA
jgi:MFS family permease